MVIPKDALMLAAKAFHSKSRYTDIGYIGDIGYMKIADHIDPNDNTSFSIKFIDVPVEKRKYLIENLLDQVKTYLYNHGEIPNEFEFYNGEDKFILKEGVTRFTVKLKESDKMPDYVHEFDKMLVTAADSRWHECFVSDTIGNLRYLEGEPGGVKQYNTIKFIFINEAFEYGDDEKEKIMEDFRIEIGRRMFLPGHGWNKAFYLKSDNLKYWIKIDHKKQLIIVDRYMSKQLKAKQHNDHGCFKFQYSLENGFDFYEMPTNGHLVEELVNPFHLTRWINFLVNDMSDVINKQEAFVAEIKLKNNNLQAYRHPYIKIRVEKDFGSDLLMSFS